jgi:hypothetical protein
MHPNKTMAVIGTALLLLTRSAFAGPPVICTAGTTDHITADAVVCWNEIAAEVTGAAGRGPASTLDFAKMHAAVHDAVQAYEHRYESYAVDIESGAGTPSAAVAKAARDVLYTLIVSQQAVIQAAYQDFLNANGLNGNAGLAVGAQAAAALLDLRADDGSWPVPAPTFFGGIGPGEWRSTTTPATSMVTPWLGSVTPFTLNSSAQLRPHGPPHLESGHYARDYNEVKALGAKVNSTRTPEQTALAMFFSDNFLMLWERTLRGIASTYVDDLGDSARMFALVHLAVADAGITAWDSKLYFNFWRPITAIREAGTDGNPRTEADATWEPLITTPNYPDYTSGANNLTSSIAHALHHFFGRDKVTFTVESRVTMTTRTYERLLDICRDVVEVRIFQGIHFRFADEVAFLQGKYAANWAASHFLRPLRGTK